MFAGQILKTGVTLRTGIATVIKILINFVQLHGVFEFLMLFFFFLSRLYSGIAHDICLTNSCLLIEQITILLWFLKLFLLWSSVNCFSGIYVQTSIHFLHFVRQFPSQLFHWSLAVWINSTSIQSTCTVYTDTSCMHYSVTTIATMHAPAMQCNKALTPIKHYFYTWWIC